MRNELWKIIGRLRETEEMDWEFVVATLGSPYDEVVKINKKQVEINPYLQYGDLLASLLEQTAFLESEEGKLLFHQSIDTLLQVERYAGCDKNFFLKKLIEKEVMENCFGEDIRTFYQRLTIEQKNRTLENILFFYQHKSQMGAFVREVVALFPKCMLFQKREEANHIYIYMGTPKDRHVQWMIERCKDLFLPMDMYVHLAWEEGFLLTDMHMLDMRGKWIV